MRLENNYAYAKPKTNVNFKSVIKPTEFLKEGFNYAKKINNAPSPTLSDLYSVKRFTHGLMDILNDGRYHLVEIAQSQRKDKYSLYYDVLINGNKVIIEDTCLGAAPSNIGKNSMDAVIRLTQKIFGLESHYERLVAGVEKRPLPFKTDLVHKPEKYSQKGNRVLLDVLERLIIKE